MMLGEANSKSLNEIWNKIHVVTTSYSVLLIVQEILGESRDLDDAKIKIAETIDKLQENNCHEFREWLRRWLQI